jgi:hypothetical protein
VRPSVEERAIDAIEDALSRLENMTTEAFQHGADKPIRDEFEAIMAICYAQGRPRRTLAVSPGNVALMADEINAGVIE